jgi:hypothetical protein
MRTPPRTARRRAPGMVAALLCLAVTATACSGGSNDSSGASGGDGTSASEGTDTPGPLTTTATLGKVAGKLPKDKRSKARKQVAQTVDQWFDAAYIDGDYPRSDFANAWPGFTTGAKADAADDEGLMSNEDIGTKISAVEATTREVTVDLLAVKGHARGATARFVLKFRTTGDVQRKIEVRGRLFLTPVSDGWRIFGYDVTKGRAA